ncbi:glycosyltransferase [Clostridium sp.]|uniref:MGDG synthase family glycosyltransferase n=1 Tax=Clostridium sp. TaxID=1506 RepID=UPI003217DB66
MKILILTGKFGMGHYSVSKSLCEEIKSKYPNVSVVIKDVFDYTLPTYSNTIYKAFNVMVNKGSIFYNQVYKITENRKYNMNPMFLRYFLPKLDELVKDVEPNIIISTLPFCSQLISRYKLKYNPSLPLITCITDISSHSEWINENTNCYLVGSNSLKKDLILKGVPENKIFINGIPVKEEFKKTITNNSSNEKQILIMGGGLGLLPKSLEFYNQLNSLENVKTTVITGNNTEIYNMLHDKYENINVLGYTDEVYKYMQQADLILSKPGGITLFESIFSETPLIAFKPFLQQEINNTNFILNNGIGKVLETSPDKCFDKIKKIIYDDTILNVLSNNIKNLKRQFDCTVIEKVFLTLEPNMDGVCA